MLYRSQTYGRILHTSVWGWPRIQLIGRVARAGEEALSGALRNAASTWTGLDFNMCSHLNNVCTLGWCGPVLRMAWTSPFFSNNVNCNNLSLFLDSWVPAHSYFPFPPSASSIYGNLGSRMANICVLTSSTKFEGREWIGFGWRCRIYHYLI